MIATFPAASPRQTRLINAASLATMCYVRYTILMIKGAWKHYGVHWVGVPIGLGVTYFIYGSITIWEILLFIIFTLLPILDEIWYAAIHYAENEHARETTNFLLAGEMKKFVWFLHDKRRYFPERIIHNYPIYCGLWLVWYAALLFEQPIIYFAVSGLLTHLMIDIANDHYELGVCKHWVWPFLLLPIVDKTSK